MGCAANKQKQTFYTDCVANRNVRLKRTAQKRRDPIVVSTVQDVRAVGKSEGGKGHPENSKAKPCKGASNKNSPECVER